MLKNKLWIVALIAALAFGFIGCNDYPVIPPSEAPTEAEIFLGNGAVWEGKNAYLIGTSGYRELVVSFNYEFAGMEVEIGFSMSGGLEDYKLNITETHTRLHADWAAGNAPYGCVGEEFYGKDSPFSFTASTTIDSIKLNTNSSAPGTSKVVINYIKVDGDEIDIIHEGRSFKDDYVWVEGSKTPPSRREPITPPKPELGAVIINRGTGDIGDGTATAVTRATTPLREHSDPSKQVNYFVYDLTDAERTALGAAKATGREVTIELRMYILNFAWWQGATILIGDEEDNVLDFGRVSPYEEMGYGNPDVTVLYRASTDEWDADISKAKQLFFIYDDGQEASAAENKITKIYMFVDDFRPNVFKTSNLGPNVMKHADSGQSVLAQRFDSGIEVRGRSNPGTTGLRVVVDKDGLGLDQTKGYRITVEGRILTNLGITYEYDDDIDGDGNPGIRAIPNTETVALVLYGAAKDGDYPILDMITFTTVPSQGDFKLVGWFYFPREGFDAFADYAAWMEIATPTYAVGITTGGIADFFISNIQIDEQPLLDKRLPEAPSSWNVTVSTLTNGGWGWDSSDNTTGVEPTKGSYGVLNIPFGGYPQFYKKATIKIEVLVGNGEVIFGQLGDHDTRLKSYTEGSDDKWVAVNVTDPAIYNLEINLDECDEPGVRLQTGNNNQSDDFKFKVLEINYSDKR